MTIKKQIITGASVALIGVLLLIDWAFSGAWANGQVIAGILASTGGLHLAFEAAQDLVKTPEQEGE